MADTRFWIIGATLSGIAWLVLMPYLLFHARRFWKHRQVDLVSKRQPVLVLCFAVPATILHLLARTYYFAVQCLQFRGILVRGTLDHPHAFHFATSMSVLWVALLDALLWIFYFNHKKSAHLLTVQWTQHLRLLDKLNATQPSKQPWTQKYGKVLGNQKHIIAVAVCIWFFHLLVGLVFVAINDAAWNAFGTIYVALINIPIVIMGCISSRFFDTLGIRSQLLSVSAVMYFSIITAAINIFVVPFGKWRVLITYLLTLYGNLAIGILMVRIKQLASYSTESEFAEYHAYTSNASLASTDRFKLFKEIWQTRELLQQFANYTVKEYSMESVLFLLEYAQFRQLVLANYRQITPDESNQTEFLETVCKNGDDNGFQLDIASGVLQTPTPENGLSASDAANLLKYLYEHYIDDESVKQVNIPWRIRKRVDAVFSKLEEVESGGQSMSVWICDAMREFECAYTELGFLLYQDSFPRFCETREYKQFRVLQMQTKPETPQIAETAQN